VRQSSRRQAFTLAAALLLFALSNCSSSASPLALVDQGLLTYDPNTGLQWLDVTQSVGRDYNDVSSQFGVGGDFYGYRYATAGELGGLFADGGLVIGEGCRGGEGSPLALYETQGLALIGLLGNTGSSYTYGITGDRPCDDIFLCANAAPSPLDDKPNLGFLAVGGSVTAAPHHSWDLDEHDPNFNYNDTGSFLVVAVPAPGSLPLLATGLGLMGW